MKSIRLDKYLADMECGTRSEIKAAARKGRVQVNGRTEIKTELKVDPEQDEIIYDGCLVRYQRWEYYMLNKPQGVISATEDKKHRTVIDLLNIPKRKDLFPVGRLDIDTEGLLLLTNDGDLAHRLLAPHKHVDKVYYARVAGILPADAVSQMAAGMTLKDETKVKPARLQILNTGIKGMDDDVSEVLLTIHEGKFHQVKRMFEALDCRVIYLKRLSMGSLKLDEKLKPGEFRPLTAEERKELLEPR